MRGRERVAVELGADRDGAHLIDHAELADVQVHLGLDRQLPHRLKDGQAGLHRARAPGAHKPARMENEHAAALVVERDLDRGESFGRIVRVRQAGGDGVQVQGQRVPAVRHGDGLGQPAEGPICNS